MKTNEQLTADVLARRDAFLTAREKQLRAAKRYAAAGLCVLAALAAAGLYRSGLLKSDPGQPLSVTADSHTTENPDNPFFVKETTSGLPEDGTGAREPTSPSPAGTTAGPSSGGSRSDSAAAQPEEPGTIPARRTEPATGRPDDPFMAYPGTAEDRDDPAEVLGDPVSEEPAGQSPNETRPSGGSSAYAGSTPPATEKNDGQPTSSPSTEPNTSESEGDTTQKGAPQTNKSATYLIYDGGLYAMGDGLTVPIPEEAEKIGRRMVIVLRDDEAVPTEALILSCPSEPQQVRTAVAADDGNEMCLMEYLGTVEELLREDMP